MSAKQVFTKVLQQIHESQQSIKVQTSIYLKKIEEYLFGGKGPQNITCKQAQLLFIGIPQKKYQGMFQLAGTTGTFGGLKKSSYYALDLIYQCVTRGKHKQVFQKVFTQCDQQDFKQLRLATHISDSKNENALELCAILKLKRPYLNQTDYIFSQQSRKIFDKWYSTQRKKKNQISTIQQQHQRKTLTQSIIIPQIDQNIMKQNPIALLDAMMKTVDVSTNLKQLEIYQDYITENQIDYMLDTFVDPVDIIKYISDMEEERQLVKFKQFMYFLVETPVTQITRPIIEKYIQNIHIQSQSFQPDVLISNFHKKINDQQKSTLSKIVPLHFGMEYKKNLTKYYFDNFVDLEKSVCHVKQNFVQNQTIKNQASVGFSLRTLIKQSMIKLCDKVQPLSQKYAQSQRLRKMIMFLESNQDFIKMPLTIRKMLNEKSIKSITLLSRKYQVLIEAYKESSVIKDVIEEIQIVLVMSRIRQLDVCFDKNLNKQQLQVLVGLFPNNNKIPTLLQYIIPKLILHLVKSLSKNNINPNSNNNNTQQLTRLQTRVKKFQLINFRQCLQQQPQKNNLTNNNSIQNYNDDQGDCLIDFLTKKNQTQSIIDKCNNFRDRVIVKFRNFFQMKKTWTIEYNIYCPEMKILIQFMTEWYSNTIKQIIQQKAYDLVHITSEFLLLAEQNVQNQQLRKYIQQLKQTNFQAYCTMITSKTKSQIQFKPYPIKKDIDDCYFNQLLIHIMDSVLKHIQLIVEFPSFEYKQHFVLRVYKFISQSFEINQTKLIGIKQLFTFSTIVTCVSEGKIMNVFYKEVQRFVGLRKYLEEWAKKQIKRIDGMLYSIVKSEYKRIIGKGKRCVFALQILQYLNSCCFSLIEYSLINYKRHSQFLLQGLQQIANQASSQIIKQTNGKLFIQQLQLIKQMTNRISSSRIQAKWTHLLKLVEFNVNQKAQKQLYVLENKHKCSTNFIGMMDY